VEETTLPTTDATVQGEAVHPTGMVLATDLQAEADDQAVPATHHFLHLPILTETEAETGTKIKIRKTIRKRATIHQGEILTEDLPAETTTQTTKTKMTSLTIRHPKKAKRSPKWNPRLRRSVGALTQPPT
jgi:hypothetical protein